MGELTPSDDVFQTIHSLLSLASYISMNFCFHWVKQASLFSPFEFRTLLEMCGANSIVQSTSNFVWKGLM